MRFLTIATTGALALFALTGAASAQDAGKAPAASDASAAVARIQVSGTFKFVVSLIVSKSLPASTSISMSPQISVGDDIYSNISITSVSVKPKSGKATATFLVPYTWIVASKSDKVNISLNISGSAFTNAGSLTDNSFLTKTITLPANGKTTTLSFSGTI